LSSNRRDGESFHFRIMVQMAAMAPTAEATTMMAISVPLPKPPPDESVSCWGRAVVELEAEDEEREMVEVWVTWTTVGPVEILDAEAEDDAVAFEVAGVETLAGLGTVTVGTVWVVLPVLGSKAEAMELRMPPPPPFPPPPLLVGPEAGVAGVVVSTGGVVTAAPGSEMEAACRLKWGARRRRAMTGGRRPCDGEGRATTRIAKVR
jgi:hypothetical protein